jgi:hypothetical protein
MCCVNLDLLCFLIVAISSSMYTFTNCSTTNFRKERERERERVCLVFSTPCPHLFFAVVEDLNKRRQPLPALDAVYFIQPSQESVKKFMQDMSGKSALYKKAYVFFSSPIGRDLLQAIKSDQSVLSRIAALREVKKRRVVAHMHHHIKLACTELSVSSHSLVSSHGFRFLL